MFRKLLLKFCYVICVSIEVSVHSHFFFFFFFALPFFNDRGYVFKNYKLKTGLLINSNSEQRIYVFEIWLLWSMLF